MIKPFIHVIDNFYDRPDAVRQRALSMLYEEPEELVGWRTNAYQQKGIRKLIETKFRVRIKYWERDLSASEACNGVFFFALSKGKQAERVGVHFDDPPDWMMLLVYLTPDAPFETGTSLWQHRETRLIVKPTRKDAARLGLTVSELQEKLLDDSQRMARWVEIDRIGNVFNRAVMFPGGLLHSATKHFGSDKDNGRIYQTFHFPIRCIPR